VYAAVVLLTQIPLSHRGSEPQVAGRMIRLFFELFQLLLDAESTPQGEAADAGADAKPAKAAKKAGKKPARAPRAKAGAKAAPKADAVADASAGVDSRLLRALLTGVNRALPYVPEGEADALIEAVSPAVFRVAHSANLGASVQAMTLLFQMLAGRAAASDRLYRALYAALLTPSLPRSASAALFLSLLFRALKADVNPKRAAATVKRLLQARALACLVCPLRGVTKKRRRGGDVRAAQRFYKRFPTALRRRPFHPPLCPHPALAGGLRRAIALRLRRAAPHLRDPSRGARALDGRHAAGRGRRRGALHRRACAPRRGGGAETRAGEAAQHAISQAARRS
jgi:hypothetical protein